MKEHQVIFNCPAEKGSGFNRRMTPNKQTAHFGILSMIRCKGFSEETTKSTLKLVTCITRTKSCTMNLFHPNDKNQNKFTAETLTNALYCIAD